MHPPKSKLSAAFSACKRAFWGLGVFGACINLLMLTGPLFMLQVYDRVLASGSLPTLVALLILVAGLLGFMGILEIIRSRILVRIGWRVDEQLSASVFDKVQLHAVGKTSKVKGQPLRDLDTLRQFLSGPGPVTLFDTPWVPIYLAVIFLMHFWLGFFACIGGAILFAFALINEFSTRGPLEQAQKSNISAHVFAEETRRNAESVHAMGMINNLRDRWQKLRHTAIEDHNKASDRSGAISGMSKSVRLLLQSAMLALGAYLAVKQEITPGVMIAASIIMSRALAPLEQSIVHWRGFLDFRRANSRLKLLFEHSPDKSEAMVLPAPKGRIEASDLLVATPDRSKALLQGINFTLEPGTSMGIIGPTGAGKSTLARVLVGAWQIQKGAVSLDGAPLEQWDIDQIGKAIGYLPQSVELFSGTVEENISRFSPDANSEAIIKAAQLANVHDLILKLPGGYKTVIGEGGENLSAGQKQRIGLARALYGDPVFVVLDEPNANLDLEGEVSLVKAMMSLKSQETTVVVIAHRPSAINSVDMLLYIKDGKQVELGQKDAVLEKITKKTQTPQRNT